MLVHTSTASDRQKTGGVQGSKPGRGKLYQNLILIIIDMFV